MSDDELRAIIERLTKERDDFNRSFTIEWTRAREALNHIDSLAAELAKAQTRAETFERQYGQISQDFAKLKAELAKAREALEPFAAVAAHDIGDSEIDDEFFKPKWFGRGKASLLLVGDFRRARAALPATPEPLPIARKIEMSDIVERLRRKTIRVHDLSGVGYEDDQDCHEAAATIERLTRERDEAREALTLIASSRANDMNTPHPEHCAAIARAALPVTPEPLPITGHSESGD